MKITKNRLKEIIKEELKDTMLEQDMDVLEPMADRPWERPERGSRGDIGADLQALQDQLQMQGGATLEGMHSILIAALGHLARAYGEKTPSGP